MVSANPWGETKSYFSPWWHMKLFPPDGLDTIPWLGALGLTLPIPQTQLEALGSESHQKSPKNGQQAPRGATNVKKGDFLGVCDVSATQRGFKSSLG